MSSLPPEGTANDGGAEGDVGEVAALLSRYIGDGPGQITQRELERQTDALGPGRRVTQATISLLILGKIANPRDRALRSIADALGIDWGVMAEALARDRASSFIRSGSDKVQYVVEAAEQQQLTREELDELMAKLQQHRDDPKGFPRS